MEEKLTFASSDGIELVGILQTPKTPTNKCVVLCHGITVDKDEGGIFVELAEKLVEKGLAVFRFDFRGHGESGGRSMDMTISGEQKDLEAAVKRMEEKGYAKFGILGASFAGGAVCFYTAEHEKKVKALVLWNALIDYAIRTTPTTEWGKKYLGQPAIDRVHKLGYTEMGNSFFRVGKKLFDEMALLEPWKALVDLGTPTLFVHGNKDNDIDYHDSVKYSLLMKNAQLEIIRGAGHGFGDEHKQEAIEKTVAFFTKHL
jgi:alpha-beta hydrolase superfamily lysophospholipase